LKFEVRKSELRLTTLLKSTLQMRICESNGRVLIIFPVILQTVTNVRMLFNGGQG